MQRPTQNIALSYSHPDLVGDIDENEKILICDSAYDLVLIENAAELFRLLMMRPDVLEQVLDAVVRRSTNCYVMPSETFNITDESSYQSEVERYRDLLNTVLDEDPDLTCVIALVALELGGVGHYGVLWYKVESNSVEIFDSMEQELRGGYYTRNFRKLATDIFGTTQLSNPACINLTLRKSLQSTGGFPENPIPALLSAPRASRRSEGNVLTAETRRILQTQSTESQNHFCYMWSIWYIHLRLLGFNPSQIIDRIADLRIDPLFVIKRYIYCIATMLGLKRDIPQLPFFERHFLSVWTNAVGVPMDSSARLNPVFQRYRLHLQPCGNIDDCVINSIANLNVTPEPNTPVPDEILEKYCGNESPSAPKRRRRTSY